MKILLQLLRGFQASQQRAVDRELRASISQPTFNRPNPIHERSVRLTLTNPVNTGRPYILQPFSLQDRRQLQLAAHITEGRRDAGCTRYMAAVCRMQTPAAPQPRNGWYKARLGPATATYDVRSIAYYSPVFNQIPCDWGFRATTTGSGLRITHFASYNRCQNQ